MSDRRRKGSLAWLTNCRRTHRTIVPTRKVPSLYFIKVGMGAEMINDQLVPITYLHWVQHEKLQNHWKIRFDLINAKRVRRKCVLREHHGANFEDIRQSILSSPKLTAVGLTKGRGTLGPVARRGIKMQKRKAAGSGVTRKPGAMGLRQHAKIVPTKPFSGRTGAARRTNFGLTNLGNIQVNKMFNGFIVRDKSLLRVKGSIMGPIGGVVAVNESK